MNDTDVIYEDLFTFACSGSMSVVQESSQTEVTKSYK